MATPSSPGTDAPALVSAADLARTYDPPVSDLDGWGLVQQHRAVLDYAAEHPRAGPSAVASATDVPRSRVRPWLREGDPAVPDAARGIQRALDAGWLPLTLAAVAAELGAWNTLAAALHSGGSINQSYVVKFAPGTERERMRVVAAVNTLDIPWQLSHQNSERRATEITLQRGSVLGRIFAALGVPVGSKTAHDALTLPPYLSVAPEWMRRQFAAIYVANRAESRFDGDGDTYGENRLRIERPAGFLDELAVFLGGVTGETVTRSGGFGIWLSKAAAEKLLAFDDLDFAVQSRTLR